MKRILFFLSLIFSVTSLFSQPEHVKTFLKCGLPGLSDYNCFSYDTVHAAEASLIKYSDKINQKEIPNYLLRRLKIMRTTAFIVIKNDEIIYENYWFNYNQDSLLNSFSVSKSIVSILIGIAIDEGKIKDINQKVCEFLPWFDQKLDSSLRIIDLLTMSSGLNWNEEFINPMSDVVKAYYGDYLDSLIKNKHVVTTPGKKWNYQCSNTIILALILEKATGLPIYKYAEMKLWIPMGAENNAYWGKSEKHGLTKSFCCFYATPKDFAKLGLLILHKGNYNGKQIVSEQYVNKMISPSSWLNYRGKNVDFYGLHLWLVKNQGEVLPYFSGMLGQYIIVFPEQNSVVIRFGEMINTFGIESVPPDLSLYLKVANKLLK